MVPNIDVNTTYTGLRPGEKLYEELLTDGENIIKTYHEKIMIAKLAEVDIYELEKCIEALSAFVNNLVEDVQLVSTMKAFLPEFVSKNSVYENLDQPKVVSMR